MLSKDRSTVWLIAGFLVLALTLSVVNYYGTALQSGIRAFSFGGGQYTKAQKQAVLTLVRYVNTGEERLITEFEEDLSLVRSLREGREIVEESDSNEHLALNYLHMGPDEPYGVLRVMWMFNRLSSQEHLTEVIRLWGEADERIDELVILAEEIFESGGGELLSEADKQAYLEDIFAIDSELNLIDSNFFRSLNSAARWMDQATNRFNWILIFVLTILIATYTIFHVRQLKHFARKLHEKDSILQAILDHSNDVIYKMDLKTGKYDYMSPAAEKMLGYDLEELKQGGAEFILSKTHPDDLKKMQQEVDGYQDEGLEDRISNESEFRVKTREDGYIWINNRRTLLKDQDGNPASIIGNVRNISERRKYEDALDASLKEKEILLSEIHHRVKNNLSIVSSLVELQKNSVENISEEDLKEIQDRIKSIALVHEKLYQTDTLADVDLADYIDDLIEMISTSFGSKSKIVEFRKDLDSVKVHITKAVPAGLIINELINNCYKYAFKESDSGLINVSLNVKGDYATIGIQDNGKGLPEDFSINGGDSLGMTLVQALTSQLEGELTFESDNGARFNVKFPLNGNIHPDQ